MTSFWDSLIPPLFRRGQSQGLVPPDKLVERVTPDNQGGTIANTYPVYEMQTPQYPAPNPFNLAQMGYRTNELVYSCIQARAMAVSEAKIGVYRETTGDEREELPDHPLAKLLKKPNPAMTSTEFLQALMIYLDIAGFSGWEIEYNNIGEPIALWPMRPDWCSFYRGPGQPLRAVRYQPYGLPPADVPIERIQMMMEFDPIYPMLKGYSRTNAALRIIGVDNASTDVIMQFWKKGAFLSGLLKTTQAMNDMEATRIRDRWRNQHGGVENAGDIAVLGSGAEYQQTSPSFRDMVFGDLDARDEARICMVYRVPPIVVGAKTGIDRSTFANFSESNRAFHQFTIMPVWRWIASQLTEQLAGNWSEEGLVVDFDTSKVKALQEDRTQIWTRAVTAATASIITRDEAREEMGLDPIDDTPVFVSSGAPAPGEETVPVETPAQLQPFTGQPGDQAEQNPEPDEMDAEQEKEAGRFKAFAEKRIREGKRDEIKNFTFHHLEPYRQQQLFEEVGLASDAPFRWESVEL